MPTLDLQLLGVPQLLIDNQPVHLVRRASLALLAYLAITKRQYPRDEIANFLGDDDSNEAARKRLRNVLTDLTDTARRQLDLTFGIADLPANGVLIVDMGGAQAVEAGDLGFQPCLLHQTLIARGDGLGHGELVRLSLAHVFQPANAGIS